MKKDAFLFSSFHSLVEISMVITSLNEILFDLKDLPTMPLANRVLMTEPTFFEVVYVINPHMKGNIGEVDKNRAMEQWNTLHASYQSLGLQVETIPGIPGQPDMVFCANQTLPFWNPDGSRGIVSSRMYAPQRRGEVVHFEKHFSERNYLAIQLPHSDSFFEGMGDALWHPGRRLLWGGYGFRTDLDVYRFISNTLDTTVITLELLDPDFYHLDTCLSLLDETTAIVYPQAFQPEGIRKIKELIPNVIEAPEDEARNLFAVNAHSPDGKHVLIQRGCKQTCNQLLDHGYIPLEVDTDEFLKAGGSVFCMKLMHW